MATRGRKAGSSGRVTPKGGAQPAPAGKAPTGKTPAGQRSPGRGSRRRGPQDGKPPVTIGRRPSSAGFLAMVAVMWMAVGVVLFLTLTTGWRLIPAILAFGIGVLFLRGAGSTVLRRERRRSTER